MLTTHYMADVEALCERIDRDPSRVGSCSTDHPQGALPTRFAAHKTVVVHAARTSRVDLSGFGEVIKLQRWTGLAASLATTYTASDHHPPVVGVRRARPHGGGSADRRRDRARLRPAPRPRGGNRVTLTDGLRSAARASDQVVPAARCTRGIAGPNGGPSHTRPVPRQQLPVHDRHDHRTGDLSRGVVVDRRAGRAARSVGYTPEGPSPLTT